MLAARLEDSTGEVVISQERRIGGGSRVSVTMSDAERLAEPALVIDKDGTASGSPTYVARMSDRLTAGSATVGTPGGRAGLRIASIAPPDRPMPGSFYLVGDDGGKIRFELAADSAGGPHWLVLTGDPDGTPEASGGFVIRSDRRSGASSLELTGHLSEGPIDVDFGDAAFMREVAVGYLDGVVAHLKGGG
jgi:hypothetical protein